MSFTAAHESKRARHVCQSCRDRKARFSYRGSVRADRDHTLCFECYRSERERQRARRLIEVQAGGGSLGDRQVAHRRTMLAHMEQTAAARGALR